jgi:hypothetical protein
MEEQECQKRNKAIGKQRLLLSPTASQEQPNQLQLSFIDKRKAEGKIGSQ